MAFTGSDLKPMIDELELRISVSNQPFCPYDESLLARGNSFQLKVGGIKKKSREEVALTIKVYNLEEFHPRPQTKCGREFTEGDFGVFTARTLDPSNLLFLLEVFCRNEKGIESLFGSCYLPGSEMSEPKECIAIATDKNGVPVGEVSVETHCIHPWLNAKNYKDLSVQTWNWNGKGLICGHRGMGRNTPDKSLRLDRKAQGSAVFPENTMAAFKQAHKLTLPMVEFDVHVTRDDIPVIFHDFDTNLGIKEEVSGKVLDLTTAHISSMTHKQIKVLRNLRSCSERSCSSDWICSLVDGERSGDLRPLPTLQEAFECVNEELAFNIEVKYPMTDVDGNEEAESGDRNRLLDCLLDVVYKFVGNRRIMFSAFDPDVCIMLRLKQHRYPVMLANYGPTDKYTSYRGLRCSSATVGVCLALSENMQGLSGHSDDYVAEPSLITTMHDNGLMLCVWGEENNDVVYIDKLKELQVDYIITDRVELVQG